MKQPQGGICAASTGYSINSSNNINTSTTTSTTTTSGRTQEVVTRRQFSREADFSDSSSSSEGECSSDTDSENNWDFGIGDLVIDLDADIERNGRTHDTGNSEELFSAQDIDYNSSMSSTASGPLKMKIKKNGPKGTANVTNNVGNTAILDNKSGENAVKSNKTNGKQGSSEKSSGKSRSGNKKTNKTPKHSNTHTSALTTTYVTSCVTVTTSVATASGSVCNVTNSSVVQKSTTGSVADPYAFSNDQFEDRMAMAGKKVVKVEKADACCSPISHASATPMTSSDAGALTDPDILGPCDPGTQIQLNGIVWHETDQGMLVVNVTWRGRSYVGTLLDNTKHAWASPSFRWSSDSPTSEIGNRKGKRCRRGTEPTTYNERRVRQTRSATNIKIENHKRKRRAEAEANAEPTKKAKPQGRTTCTAANAAASAVAAMAAGNSCDIDGFFVCHEPNCNKKYRHINNLKYHASHAHSDNVENDNNNDADEEDLQKQSKKPEVMDIDVTSTSRATTPVTVPTQVPVKKTSSPVPTATPVKEPSKVVKTEPIVTQSASPTLSCSGGMNNSPVSITTSPGTIKAQPQQHPPMSAVSTLSTSLPNVFPVSLSINPTSSDVMSQAPTRKVTATTSVIPIGVPVPLSGARPVSPSKVEEFIPQTTTTNNGSEVIAISHGKYKLKISGPQIHLNSPQSTSFHGNGSQAALTSSTARGTTVSIPVAVTSTTGLLVAINDGKARPKYEKTEKKPIPQIVQKGLPVQSNLVTVPPKCSTGMTTNPPLKPIQPKPARLGEPVHLQNNGLCGSKDNKRSKKKRSRDKDSDAPQSIPASPGHQLMSLSPPNGSTAATTVQGGTHLSHQGSSNHPMNKSSHPGQVPGQPHSMQQSFHIISHSDVSQAMNQELLKLSSSKQRTLPPKSATQPSGIEQRRLSNPSADQVYDSNSVIKTVPQVSHNRPPSIPPPVHNRPSSVPHSVLDKARQHSASSRQPPSSASLSNTVRPETGTPTDTRSMDVVSPAYSDISDANDTGSVGDMEPGRAEGQAPGNSALNQDYYSRTSPYNMSAPQQSVLTGMNSPLRSDRPRSSDTPSNPSQPSHPSHSAHPSHPAHPSQSIAPPRSMSQVEENDLRRRQMYYQYISTFGIPVDPSSHHLLLANPNYKQEYERLVDQQAGSKAVQQGKGNPKAEPVKSESSSEPPRSAEVALREKQQENQQILRDSFEARNQMQRSQSTESRSHTAAVKTEPAIESNSGAPIKEERKSTSHDDPPMKASTPTPARPTEQFPPHMVAGMPAGLPPGGFPGYFPPQPYMPYGMPFDPNNPAFRCMNPALLGYPGGFVPGVRFPNPPVTGTQTPEKAKNLDNEKMEAKHAGTPSPASGQHKIYELADGKRKHKVKAEEDEKSSGTAPSPSRAGYKTPPPQRHLHTHHHTHVVGPNYPTIYDPYAAGVPPGQTPSGTSRPPSTPSK